NRDDDFAAHDLTFEMGVSIVFASAIVSIGARRRVGRQFFQPRLVIVMQPGLIVVDEHRGGDVHRVNQTKTFNPAALTNKFLDFRCDVNESASTRYLKPKMFSERFHIDEVDRRELRGKARGFEDAASAQDASGYYSADSVLQSVCDHARTQTSPPMR